MVLLECLEMAEKRETKKKRVSGGAQMKAAGKVAVVLPVSEEERALLRAAAGLADARSVPAWILSVVLPIAAGIVNGKKPG